MADAFNTEAFTLLGVGIFIIGVRTLTRFKTVKSIREFAVDDYLMLVAAVIYGLETGCAYSVGARYMGLANNSMTPQQRATLSPNSKEYQLRVGGSKLQLMGWSSYTLLLWTLKTCVCTYYSRMTTGIAHMRIRIRLGFAFIFITYIITISGILGGCGAPFRKNWQINPDPGNHCQPAISHIDLFVTVILNVLTDAYLLSIPIPLLWRSQISAKEKAALLTLFSGALFIMMAGILRCVLILIAGPKSAEQAGSWAVRETFVAVVVSNMPIIYSLLRGLFKSLSEYTITISKRSTLSSSSRSRSQHMRLGDMSGSSRDRDRPVVRSARSRDPYHITSSSLEHIIQEDDIESKPHHSRNASAAQAGIPGSNAALEGPRSPRITVATRTEVCSEAAPDALRKGNGGADGLYQCRVSIEGDSPPTK